MKMQYIVTVNSDIDEEKLKTIMTTLSVEFNYVINDLVLMFDENIAIQWEEVK